MSYKVSLKAARINAGMTQRQAAAALSVNPATIGSWENGMRSPKVELLYKLCEIYRVSIDTIFLQSMSS